MEGEALAGRLPRAQQRAFLGVFAAGLLTFMGLGSVVTVLPRYVKGPLGGSDLEVGIITGAFALTAVFSRPFAGWAADAKGRRVVVLAGALLSAVAGAIYFIPAGMAGLIASRLALGAGEGCAFTAGAAWSVDLSPPDRRGRTIGLFGLAIWSSLTLGPVIGELLLSVSGYKAVWVFATVTPLLGALVARSLPDHRPRPGEQGKRQLIPRESIRPGIALSLSQVGYAALASFIVLDLNARGVSHPAGVFTAFAAAVVGIRLLGGRLPDVVGPRRMAIAAGVAEAVGLGVLALASSWPVAAVGAVIMGCGFSTLYPSLALIVVNRVGEARRGAALGTFTAFFDIGFGLGGLMTGAVASVAGYQAVFWFGGGAAVAAACVAATNREARLPRVS